MLKRSLKRVIVKRMGRVCLGLVMVLVITASPKVSNSHETVVNDFVLELDQNYPNPYYVSVAPFTTIKYSVPPSGGHVSINLYNLLGEQIQNLVEQDLGSNQYSYKFYAGALPSGQYTYRMVFTGPDNVSKISKKMYLIR